MIFGNQQLLEYLFKMRRVSFVNLFFSCLHYRMGMRRGSRQTRRERANLFHVPRVPEPLIQMKSISFSGITAFIHGRRNLSLAHTAHIDVTLAENWIHTYRKCTLSFQFKWTVLSWIIYYENWLKSLGFLRMEYNGIASFEDISVLFDSN